MARIAGVDLPRGKRIEVALTYIYGIGHTRAGKILESCGVNPDRRTQDLGDEEIKKNIVTLRNMSSGEQQNVPIDNLKDNIS